MPPRTMFADTFYLVALLNPRDPFYARVTSVSGALGATRLVTTDEVLTEVLNWFSRSGPLWRKRVVQRRGNRSRRRSRAPAAHGSYTSSGSSSPA